MLPLGGHTGRVLERVLYFDCFSGLAGDMTVGALLDLGVPADGLRAALDALRLPAWTMSASPCVKRGVRGLKVRFQVGGEEEGAAVDAPDAPPDPADARPHLPDPAAPEMAAPELLARLDGAALPDEVRSRARAALAALLAAEAAMRDRPVESLRFPALEGVDLLLDLTGSAYGLWALGVTRVEAAPVPLGRGFIRCGDGRLPSPTPTTLALLAGLHVAPAGLDRELVTPTGAALLRALCVAQGGLPAMRLLGTGYGAGNADFPDRPNLLRLLLGERGGGAPAGARDTVVEVEPAPDFSADLAASLSAPLGECDTASRWRVRTSAGGLRLGARLSAEAARGLAAAWVNACGPARVRRYQTSAADAPARSPGDDDVEYLP